MIYLMSGMRDRQFRSLRTILGRNIQKISWMHPFPASSISHRPLTLDLVDFDMGNRLDGNEEEKRLADNEVVGSLGSHV